jgi:broad specificity phosphatase PhoE
MAVFVIRHADKEAGPYRTEGLPLSDQPLSALGRAKAAALGARFEGVVIDSIRVSEYVRTRQTIEALAAARGLPLEVDPRLNEVDIGELEGLADEEVEARYPDFWKAFLARDRDFAFPGGESGEDASARVMSAFASLPSEGNHILVAHDGIIRVLLCGILGLPSHMRHLFQVDFCSLTEFEYDARFSRWRVLRINQS